MIFSPRRPAPYGLRIFLIRTSKLTLEIWLFVEQHIEMNESEPPQRIQQKIPVLQKQRFAEKKQQHTKIHRIAHVAIEASDNQFFWMINRRRNAAPPRGKLPNTAQVDGGSQSKRNQRRQPCDRPRSWQPKSCTVENDAGKPECYCSGNQHGEYNCFEKQTYAPQYAHCVASQGGCFCRLVAMTFYRSAIHIPISLTVSEGQNKNSEQCADICDIEDACPQRPKTDIQEVNHVIAHNAVYPI